MLFIITGKDEDHFDVANILKEEEEIGRLAETLSEGGATLYKVTGDEYFLYMTILLTIRLGVWIERNAPELTNEFLGEGMSLEELRDLDEEGAYEKIVLEILREQGQNN